MLDSGILEFKLDYWRRKNTPFIHRVGSDDITVGGHVWRVYCYPIGCGGDDDPRPDQYDRSGGQYVSIFLTLRSKSTTGVKAMFHVFSMGEDGKPSFAHEKRLVHVFSSQGSKKYRGWRQFMRRSVLESLFRTNGWITFLYSIVVLGTDDDTIEVPPSDLGGGLGALLDSNVGIDVLFMVNGELVPAHRAVLAARSPVFKAQLFGSTADATSRTITVKDVEPSVFKAMLQFMYRDELPTDVDHELVGDSSPSTELEMLQRLLAAADRYQVDRLKLTVARRLWDTISVDTFASTVVCADTYNCPELKDRCIDFFASEENFKKIVFTDGFMWLVQNFPLLAAKLQERIGTVQRA